MTAEKQAQVALQCKAVAHLSTVLAKIHKDYALLFDKEGDETLIEIVGKRTAGFMESMGDMLNSMDAISEEDAWIDPVFQKAQQLWPESSPPAEQGASHAG